MPSASAPSRTVCGTERIACSDVRTSSGSISIMNAKEAENAEKCFSGATKTA